MRKGRRRATLAALRSRRSHDAHAWGTLWTRSTLNLRERRATPHHTGQRHVYGGRGARQAEGVIGCWICGRARDAAPARLRPHPRAVTMHAICFARTAITRDAACTDFFARTR